MVSAGGPGSCYPCGSARSHGETTVILPSTATLESGESTGLDASCPARRVRLCYFNTWAGPLEPAHEYLGRLPAIELAPLVSNPADPALLAKARLDCDWYGENTRVFAAVASGEACLPAWVCGVAGVLQLAKAPRGPGEERWLVMMGHQPQALGKLAGRVLAMLGASGVRLLFYAFDEASRFMPCFGEIAPHLDVLVHDELPLEETGRMRLKACCRTLHRSWVANVIPFSVPFNEAPQEKVLFLGSKLGLTPHRERQIRFLKERLKDRFVAIHDHSVAVGERPALSRFKVGLCPEGRKFATPAMALTHTDRPFWSGCCGLVPVSEDSREGGRLGELARQGLVLRYDHGDLGSLLSSCEQALAMENPQRRRIYDHFNRHENVGTVVAEAITGGVRGASKKPPTARPSCLNDRMP